VISTRQLELDTDRWASFLAANVRPHLKPDVSSYAKGRLRVWLGEEPNLGRPGTRPGLVVPGLCAALEEIIDWPFDYCLVTYSGDEQATGILPHRDASYANYEAMGLNIIGRSRFLYWNDRQDFGKAPSSGVKGDGPPTHDLVLTPGTLVRFNCKNLHQSVPEPRRWNMNFWRAK
jgi:hypothetical protein